MSHVNVQISTSIVLFVLRVLYQHALDVWTSITVHPLIRCFSPVFLLCWTKQLKVTTSVAYYKLQLYLLHLVQITQSHLFSFKTMDKLLQCCFYMNQYVIICTLSVWILLCLIDKNYLPLAPLHDGYTYKWYRMFLVQGWWPNQWCSPVIILLTDRMDFDGQLEHGIFFSSQSQ